MVLDFDRTYTPDPYLWDVFLELALHRGHKVLLVSGRRDDEDNRRMLRKALGKLARRVEIHLLSHQPKRAALQKLGIFPDIWIDDLPEAITATDQQHLRDIYQTFPTCETHGPHATP